MRILLLFCFSISSLAVHAQETALSFPQTELNTIACVGPWGVGNEEARVAWKKLAAIEPSQLPQLLQGFDRCTVLSANWVRTAAEAVLQKAKQSNQLEQLVTPLEEFAANPAHAPAGRLFAMEILRQQMSSDKFNEYCIRFLDDSCRSMRRPAVADLIANAEKMRNNNVPNAASIAFSYYRDILQHAYDYDQVDQIVNAMTALNEKEKLGVNITPAELRGFLVKWDVIGPFDNTGQKGFDTEYGPEKEVSVLSERTKTDASYPGKHGEVRWKPVRSDDPLGILQFNDLLGKEKNVIAYAATEIESMEARNVTLRLSSFNALKVWVNGKLLGGFETYHGHEEPDQYVLPIELPQGKSTVLVKVCQNDQPQEYAWEWKMRCRLVQESSFTGMSAPEQKTVSSDADGEKNRAVLKSRDFGTRPTSWSQFRGPGGNPVLDSCSKELDDALGHLSERNVLWKSPLPGSGPSSPILVGDLVVVTAASGPRQEILHTIALDAKTGEKRWERTIRATGSVLFQQFGGVASNTPASDGNRIVALFSSNDVACFDKEGNLLWLRGLAYEKPRLRIDTGMSSSPLILGDIAVVQCASQGEAFLAALDMGCGKDVWRTVRPKEQIWSSPASMFPSKQENGKTVAWILANRRDALSVIDPTDGHVFAEYPAECNTITSPTAIDTIIYLQANAIHRICFQSESLVSSWVEPKLRSDNPSPVIASGKLYTIKAPGILMCNEIESGNMDWQIRLEGPFWVTPIVVGNHLIAVNHAGLVQVVELTPDEKGKIVANLQLDPKCLATPAADSDAVYFRTHEFLWKIGHTEAGMGGRLRLQSTPVAAGLCRIEDRNFQPSSGLSSK